MSNAFDLHHRLEFGLPDRLAKALEVSDTSVNDMAEHLGVVKQTIGNYTSGRTTPKRVVMLQWALKTGVPLSWLETGTLPTGDGDGGSPIVHISDYKSASWASTQRLAA